MLFRSEPFKKGKTTYIRSTELGRDFYNMLPDSIRKVDVTAKWFVIQEGITEGKYTPKFMAENVLMSVNKIIETGEGRMSNADKYAAPQGLVVGKCPKCGGDVCETLKSFKCRNSECKFALWKDNKWLKTMNKSLSIQDAKNLLSTGKTTLAGCSSKDGKYKYNLSISADFTGEYPNFKKEDSPIGGSLGHCPRCRSNVFEYDNVYKCSNQECKFLIYKSQAIIHAVSANFGAKDVSDLLSGKAPILRNCKSRNPEKSKKVFTCKLIADFKSDPVKLNTEIIKK